MYSLLTVLYQIYISNLNMFKRKFLEAESSFLSNILKKQMYIFL